MQGAGGGTITPLALTLILPHFPGERRGTAIGLWTATQSAAVAAGPAIGGALVSALGWRAVFWLQVPVGLIALGGTAWALRGETGSGGSAISRGEAGPGEADSRVPAGGGLPDLAGVGLLGAAIGLLSLGVVESSAWGALSWRTDLALIGGVGLGVVFVLRTLRHPAPIVDLQPAADRPLRLANAAMAARRAGHVRGAVRHRAVPDRGLALLGRARGPRGYARARSSRRRPRCSPGA